MKILIVLLILMPLVSACTTLQSFKSPTAFQRENAVFVEILQGTPDKPYISLGVVRGSGCLKSTFDPNIPESDAIQRLKFEAVSLSADAVMNPACKNANIDWFTDCFILTECTGEAIRFTEK